MNKADFRSMRRRLIRAVNKNQKNVQRGNARGLLPHIDTMPAKYCVRDLRLKKCILLA